ncbi:MAG: hypothetical protein K1X79_02395 [Oligoflexia bacterium]|nr:hypothetical protein [Oligoflexia bacterium]
MPVVLAALPCEEDASDSEAILPVPSVDSPNDFADAVIGNVAAGFHRLHARTDQDRVKFAIIDRAIGWVGHELEMHGVAPRAEVLSLFCQLVLAYFSGNSSSRYGLDELLALKKGAILPQGVPEQFALLFKLSQEGQVSESPLPPSQRASREALTRFAKQYQILGEQIGVASNLRGAEAIAALWAISGVPPQLANSDTEHVYVGTIGNCFELFLHGEIEWWKPVEFPEDMDDGNQVQDLKSPKLDPACQALNEEKQQRDRIRDLLVAARESDFVEIQLEDGRTFRGALVFNPFTGEGRLINLDEEFSFDFHLEQVQTVKIS